MRYVLRLEAIGDNYHDQLRRFEKSKAPFTRREIDAYRYGNKSLSPWCARITGMTPQGSLRREFVTGSKDYTFGDKLGKRGIYFYYPLKPGIYEINERQTLRRARRYFLQVNQDATAQEITKDQVIEWLQQNANAS